MFMDTHDRREPIPCPRETVASPCAINPRNQDITVVTADPRYGSFL